MSVAISKKITGFKVIEKTAPPAPALAVVADTDRRLQLKPVEGLAERSLRTPKRPSSHLQTDHHGQLHQGFAAWNSDTIRTPGQRKFALSISSYQNGVGHPFEVWALGREAPDSASEICQILSKIMQVDCPHFLRYHLEALKSAKGTPFDLTEPYSGKVVSVPSVGAAIAHVVEAHARAIGYIDDAHLDVSKSPMLLAMSSTKEPKTQGQGGLAYVEDIFNPTTGESFPLFIKEGLLPDGKLFPFSIWFGGNATPAESESICKLVSLALRHSDPFWTMQILGILAEHAPAHGSNQDFWGPVPGHTEKQAYYRSTWAYVAQVVIHRLKTVGRIDEQGRAVEQRQLFADLAPEPVATQDAIDPLLKGGSECPSCGEKACYVRDGCLSCVSCSWSRCG